MFVHIVINAQGHAKFRSPLRHPACIAQQIIQRTKLINSKALIESRWLARQLLANQRSDFSVVYSKCDNASLSALIQLTKYTDS